MPTDDHSVIETFKFLAKIARASFLKKVLKYRLSMFKYDIILDYKDHALVVLNDIPGVIIFKLETTEGKTTHYEALLLSEGEQTLLDRFYLDEKFPVNKPNLYLVK